MRALDPSYLINIANLFILPAFAVRDVLLLRSLFLTGSVIAWTVLYSVIHAYWIVRITMERRPVVLTPDEETPYRLAFRSLDKHKFTRMQGFDVGRLGLSYRLSSCIQRVIRIARGAVA